jgi:hypothetical protein
LAVVVRTTSWRRIRAGTGNLRRSLRVDGHLQRLENNLLFNADKPVGDAIGQILGYGWNPQDICYSWQGLTTIDELTAHIQSSCSPSTPGMCQSFGGSKVSGNVTLNATCGTDSGCIPWAARNSTTSWARLQSVFEGWTEPHGLGTLFSRLEARPGSAVRGRQSSLSGGLATDAFGTTRTAAVDGRSRARRRLYAVSRGRAVYLR